MAFCRLIADREHLPFAFPLLRPLARFPGLGLTTGLALANGLVVAWLRLPAFIVTLGMLNVAYASTFTFWPMAHGVAESEEDMEALLLGGAAQVDEPIALLVPSIDWVKPA